jgi:hypothetical protein
MEETARRAADVVRKRRVDRYALTAVREVRRRTGAKARFY